MKKLLLALLLLSQPLSAQIVLTPSGNITNIVNPSTGPANTNFLVEGCQVVAIGGLEVRVSACNYYIQATNYTSAEVVLELSEADPTNPRIDAIIVNTSGVAAVVTGTAAANPSRPDIDPGTQLDLTFILVPNGATDIDVTDTIIYDDNAGGPGEWNCTTSGSGIVVNSTANPLAPSTHNMRGTNMANGAYARCQIPSGTFDPNSVGVLVFYIDPTSTWNNNRGLTVTLRSNGVLVGQAITINRSGTFGFLSSNLTYQQIAIPVTQFAVANGLTINQVQFTDFGGAINFDLDNVSFQGSPDIEPPAVGITLAEADARYLKLPAYESIGCYGLTEVGSQCTFYLPYAVTLIGWQMYAVDDISTTAEVDIWRDSSTYPPTDADSITGGNEPAIAATSVVSTTMTGWTTSLPAGWWRLNLDSISGGANLAIQLTVQRQQ